MSEGVREVLDGLGYGLDEDYGYTNRLGHGWRAGDKDARKEVEAALKRAGLTIDAVTAKTVESNLDSFERLDRMLASAEARRNNALREIDRHRDALGADVRRSIGKTNPIQIRLASTGRNSAKWRPRAMRLGMATVI
jgi:hypothetical protein